MVCLIYPCAALNDYYLLYYLYRLDKFVKSYDLHISPDATNHYTIISLWMEDMQCFFPLVLTSKYDEHVR